MKITEMIRLVCCSAACLAAAVCVALVAWWNLMLGGIILIFALIARLLLLHLRYKSEMYRFALRLTSSDKNKKGPTQSLDYFLLVPLCCIFVKGEIFFPGDRSFVFHSRIAFKRALELVTWLYKGIQIEQTHTYCQLI